MNPKKIGIITMHRVLNFGSALQAYALQRKLIDLGYDNELINYVFPTSTSHKKTIKSKLLDFLIGIREIMWGFPTKTKKRRFYQFYQKHFILSPKEYSHEAINETPPVYNIYMTGSDQVWSPKHVKDNTDFMCTFAPDNSKLVSYGASFAVESIPSCLKEIYSKALSRYSAITVREDFGCNIVKELTDKQASVVCDPTLLLEKEHWNILADYSQQNESVPYILVYILSYMYNPYPDVEHIVKHVQKELGYRVIYLNGGKNEMYKPNSKIISDAGPCEFLDLIRNAKFVITTSFHGVALACVLGIPFYGIIKNEQQKGDRIQSLLRILNCKDSIIAYNAKPTLRKNELTRYTCRKEELTNFKQYSIKKLVSIINDSNNN